MYDLLIAGGKSKGGDLPAFVRRLAPRVRRIFLIGETAPLLLTSLASNDQSLNLGAPMNAMTVVIYNYAGSSDPQRVAQAWTTALVLFAVALVLNVSVRFKTVNSRVA